MLTQWGIPSPTSSSLNKALQHKHNESHLCIVILKIVSDTARPTFLIGTDFICGSGPG